MTTFIDHIEGDIFDDPHANVLVNPVNCIGVMGGGLALQFKHAFPHMYEEYRKRCGNRLVRLGQMDVHYVSAELTIVNFPTKGHWREQSELRWIAEGLEHLSHVLWDMVLEGKHPVVAMPRIGCGLGGLDWDVVKPIVILHLIALDGVTIRIYG